MSHKLLDNQGRHRSVAIAFRVSPEEAQVIDSLVAASGLTKQDYITARLQNREVTVIPSSRTYKASGTRWAASTASSGASARAATSTRTSPT